MKKIKKENKITEKQQKEEGEEKEEQKQQRYKMVQISINLKKQRPPPLLLTYAESLLE